MRPLLIAALILGCASGAKFASADSTYAIKAGSSFTFSKHISRKDSVVKPLPYSKRNELQSRLSIEEFEDAIYELEGSYGPYDSQISQELIGLGLAYQETGDHDKAIETFQRAIHVTRVNEGLYNMTQVRMIEQIIESHIALNDWEKAEEQHMHLFWLNRRNFESQDPQMLPMVAKLGHWHLQAFKAKTETFHHLVHAHELFRLAVNIVDNAHGQLDPRLLPHLRGLAASNYYLHTHFGDALTQFDEEFIAAKKEINSPHNRLMHYTRNSRRSGARALNRMLDVYDNTPGSSSLEKAKVEMHLADWKLMFGHKNIAHSMYKKIYQNLWQDESMRSEVTANFSQPTPLPDMSILASEKNSSEEELSEPYVLLEFDLSAFGQLKNIKVIDTNTEDKKMIQVARRTLKRSKFRPRMTDGEIAATKGVVHRYVFEQ